MAIVFLGIGSNVGDREANFAEALERLNRSGLIDIVERSSYYLTKPVGGPEQDDFLNGVLRGKTDLLPLECLEHCKNIEHDMGRRAFGEDHPRIIDLDILLYDDLVLRSKVLTIPHSEMHRRYFVLRGINEIDPKMLHPVTGLSIECLFNDVVEVENEKVDGNAEN